MNYTKSVIEEQEKNIVGNLVGQDDEVTEAEKEAFWKEMDSNYLMQKLDQSEAKVADLQAKVADLQKEIDQLNSEKQLYGHAAIAASAHNYQLIKELPCSKLSVANRKVSRNWKRWQADFGR